MAIERCKAEPESHVPRDLRSVPWMVAALVAIAAMGAFTWGWLRTPRAEARAVRRWIVTLPDAAGPTAIALSHDGARLAYASAGLSARRLIVRMLDRPEGNAIPGTEGALGPSFSPDGEWIAYQTSDVLKKVQATGGPSITLCEGMVPSGLSWGDDNTIVIGSEGLDAGPFGRGKTGGSDDRRLAERRDRSQVATGAGWRSWRSVYNRPGVGAAENCGA